MIWGENPPYSETSLFSLEKTAPSIFGGSPLDTQSSGEDWLVDAGGHGHFLLPLVCKLLERVEFTQILWTYDSECILRDLESLHTV